MNQSQIATIAVVAVVGVAAVGGGLAYAAKDAQPGDMLYGLRASLYDDVNADGDIQANFEGAADVYAEASDLDDRGALTASERTRLTAQYSLHVNAIMSRIAELEAEGDLEAAADLRTELRTTLRDHNDIFPNVGSDSSASSSAMSDDATTSEGATSAGGASSGGMTGSQGATTSAGASQGAASSIFVQPSSSVTSA